VGVGADGGHARQAEVEHRDVVAELLAPRQDEPAQAAVDVQADAALDRQVAERLDGVDGAVAVVAGRPDDRDGVLVDARRHLGDLDGGRGRVDRGDAQLDAEQVAGLVERRVGGLGLHDVRVR
jgi:hypothetical protein